MVYFTRFFLLLQYHGRKYHGWQSQKDVQTVQDAVQTTLSIRLNRNINCHGCSRLDKGVHAHRFFCNLDLQRGEEDGLLYAVNKMLPPDIYLLKLLPVSLYANAQHDAIWKEYIYNIVLEKDPFLIQENLWISQTNLDVKKLEHSTRFLIGHHNFESFCKKPAQYKNHLCQINSAYWEIEDSGKMIFHITGNRFLQGMVRLLVGNLLEIAKGNLSEDLFLKALTNQISLPFFNMAPAHALALADVKYPDNIFL